MENLLVLLILGCFIGGCSAVAEKPEMKVEPPMKFVSTVEDELVNLPRLDAPIMTIAVYDFKDQTGQRKPSEKFSQLSTAVTQGAENFVIDALQRAGDGDWFMVIERHGLNNLVKERQLAKSAYDIYDKDKKESKPTLQPLKLAGLILEGGITGYDTNIVSGGSGLRYFGIGGDTEYRTDQVTVSMRLVSVNTGKVLMTINTSKTIASVKDDFNVFRFFDLGTKAFELESGSATNEPTSMATKAAIDQAVIEMIYKGEKKGLWKFSPKSLKEDDIYITNEEKKDV